MLTARILRARVDDNDLVARNVSLNESDPRLVAPTIAAKPPPPSIASSRRSVSKAQRDKWRAKKIKKSAGRGSEGTPVVKLNKRSFRPLIDRLQRLVT